MAALSNLFRRAPYVAIALLLIVALPWLAPAADKEAADRSPADRAAEKASAALNAPGDAPAKADDKDAAKTGKPDETSLFEFYKKGGPLMYPITVLSLISIGFTLERLIALRRRKIVPPKLVKKLGELATTPGGFDPRLAYKLCQQYPSSTANVIRALLLKVGRPNSEVESTVQSTSDREASRLYANIRPIALCATIAPMMGLLGTVLGMILLFHAAATPGAGMDKALLADGIYTKLITTFAGLCVAIPSAIFTQLFEAKIISMFHDVADLAQSLIPQVERYEGKLRVTSKQLAGDGESPVETNGSNGSHGTVPPVVAGAKK